MGKIMLEVLAKDSGLVPAPVPWHHAELGHQAWEGIPDPPGQPPAVPWRVFSRVTEARSRAVMVQPRALHGLLLS